MVNNIYDAIKCTEVQIKQLPLKESSKDPANLRHDMAYLNIVTEALDLLRKKEIGLISELPCKVGDTVYLTRYAKDRTGWIVTTTCAGIHISDKVSRYYRDKPLAYLVVRSNNCGFSRHIPLSTIGKTTFFTREAAEGALKGAISNEQD